jgi:hypothetical protein
MPRLLAAAALLVLAAHAAAADPKYAVKVEDADPPKELGDAVRAALSNKAMSVSDEKGKLIMTVWPAKSLATKATAEQAKAGLKYSQVEETTVIGAVKLPEVWKDYRDQKIKPGVYTLRISTQLMDGNHMGTAPYNEFALLCPAELDKKPDLMDVKDLHDLSSKSTTRKHPGIMLMFPNKTPKEEPVVQPKPQDNFVLSYRVPATAGGEKSHLGFSLVFVGVTMAE